MSTDTRDSEPTEGALPRRARFAHWLLSLVVEWLDPWLSLGHPDEPEDWKAEYAAEADSAYEAGLERGYNEGRWEFERRDEW